MNHTNDLENLEDLKARRREQKKRPQMKQHGRSLKKLTNRGVLKIAKVERRKRKK